MSRRMSRALASAGVIAATAGAVAFTSTTAQAAPRFANGHIAWPENTVWSESAADGSDVHTVTPSGGGWDATGRRIGNVAYSPDGTKVAFTATIGSPASAGELWIADTSGANAHRVLSTTAVYDVVWAPDGKKLYFANAVTDIKGQIAVINVDGSGLTVLPNLAGLPDCSAYWPTVAPNGRVGFTTRCGTSPLAYAAVLDPGATVPRILSGVRPNTALAFSPDGAWVAYSQLMGPVSGVFIKPVNGGGAIRVSSASTTGAIAWAPDGASLLVWTTSASAQGGGSVAALNKVAAKADSPLVPIHTEAYGDNTFQAGWQNGASTAPARPTADRIGGTDRIDTAVRASQWSFDAVGTGGRQAATAVITRSDTFADALAGNALAAEKDGPLFMTDTTTLDPRVKDELLRILPHGATVYILGGTRALNPQIDAQIGALGFSTVRVAGDGKRYADDRYGTAQAIADTISGENPVPGAAAVPNQPTSVFVATGDNYPDALAAGAAAAHDPAGTGVVMLSAGKSLLPWTRDYLARLDPRKTHIYTVGGQATTAVADAFPAWNGLTTPLAGANRFETAYKVASSAVFAGGFSEAGIATAANWPDALSGGALIGLQRGPLLLSDTGGLTGQELSVLKAPGLGGVTVFGGPAVVSDQTLAGAADYAFGVGGWDKGLNRKAPALR